jgi:hypothetical protein
MLLSFTPRAAAVLVVEGKTHAEEAGDSIMAQVMHYADSFAGYVRAYNGELYVKGVSRIAHKNFLYRAAPWAFPFKHSHEGDISELLCDIRFEAPNHLTISPTAMRTSHKKSIKSLVDVSPLLNLNIYSATSFGDKFIMPGSAASKGVYYYRLDSVYHNGNEEVSVIRFLPRRKNLNLISGWLHVSRGTPIIVRIDAEGFLDIAKFHLTTTFGSNYQEFMLPVDTRVTLVYNVLNNISVNEYQCSFSYHNIDIDPDAPRKTRDNSLDRTRYYALNSDHVAVVPDSAFWAHYRGKPLEGEERQYYQDRDRRDSLRAAAAVGDTVFRINYARLPERMVSPIALAAQSDHMSLSYSGVLNPSMIGYSKRNGVVIRQRLLLSRQLAGDRLLTLYPEVGYGFRNKEFFYRFDIDWLYRPGKLGNIDLSVYNGTKGFGSSFIEAVNNVLDTVSANVKFGNLFINYYRDHVIRLENSFELTNGLMLYNGISYNIHRIVRRSGTGGLTPGETESLDAIKRTYTDFIPYVRLVWTPRQYYRMIGQRKLYLDSPLPTFAVEYAQGIAGVMGSTSRFSRLEFDMHQRIALSKLRAFSYRVGSGGFFNQRSEYFVDYHYFRPSNYPSSWSDHIGGVFNLLGNEWFYSSPQYAQVHVMYESPYILLHLFKRISRFILTERIYAGQLFTKQKPYYTEVGYGLGNYICNVAVFTSFQRGKVFETGLRVSLELGRYW